MYCKLNWRKDCDGCLRCFAQDEVKPSRKYKRKMKNKINIKGVLKNEK